MKSRTRRADHCSLDARARCRSRLAGDRGCMLAASGGPDVAHRLDATPPAPASRWRGRRGAPPSYGPCRTRRSPSGRVGGDQSAPSRESAPRKPPTTARITTAATNSSAAMSDPPLATGGAGGLHLADGCGLTEQVIDVQLRHHGAVVQERRGHGVLLRCLPDTTVGLRWAAPPRAAALDPPSSRLISGTAATLPP